MASGWSMQVHRGVDDLAQVVGRDVRGHADRDALAAVDQQVGEAAGSTVGSSVEPSKFGDEVDRVLVDAGEHVHGERRQPALGVAVGGRRVVGSGEPKLPCGSIEQVAEREVLAHADERVVHGLVAVGVVLAQHVADDGRALAVVPVGPQAALVHRPEDPAVHRLEAVAHVGQRPATR